MSNVLSIAMRACKDADGAAFSDAALKTAEGIRAIAECCEVIHNSMEYAPKKELNAVSLLFTWLDSLSAETVQAELSGIGKILDWLKPYVLHWEDNLQQLLAVSIIDLSTFDRLMKKKIKWSFLYRTDVLNVLKGKYDYSWYRFPKCLYYEHPRSGVKILPEKMWCELLDFYSEKNVDYGVFAVGMFLAGYRKVIRILQERGSITDDVKSKLASYVTEENRAWYSEITGEDVSTNALMAQVFAQGNEEKTLEFLEQNAANITDESLLERILHTYPTGLKFDKRFFENERLFRSAITAYGRYSAYFTPDLEKEMQKYFKQYYSADAMREFALSYYDAFLGRKLYRVLPKALKDDVDFWVSLYEVRKADGHTFFDLDEFPLGVCRNQEFLKKCTKVCCMSEFSFNKYYRYETQEDIDYSLQYALVDVKKLPSWFTAEITNILRVAENNSPAESYERLFYLSLTLDMIPREKFADKQFVLLAENYKIDRAEFYKRLDLSLRKDEDIWKFWLQGVPLQKIEKSVPAIVKGHKDFPAIIGK